MKTSLLYFTVLGLFSGNLYSQFATDFSEGNLEAWQGDKSNFIINPELQLQLNAPAGSTTSWLYTSVTYTDSMVWDLFLKMDFAPSTSNQLKVFLATTTDDLATTSGYFFEIGASGNEDPLEFIFRDNGSDTLLATSAPGLVADEPVELKLRIIKDAHGEWTFYKIAASIPQLLFSTNHDAISLSNMMFFGLQCKYSDTRRDKFYFDDISLQPIMPDVIAPKCISLEVIDAMTVKLNIDEPLDESTIASSDFALTPGNTSPSTIEVQQPNILLHWNEPFTSQVEYTLSIQQLKDLAGNVMMPDHKQFTYIDIRPALPYELLITEIMADPNPAIALPELEYIELYNAGSTVFILSDYTLHVGSGEKALPDSLINSHEFVILCDKDDIAAFENFGRVVAISNFPSLTNGGADIRIKDEQDNIIHEVSYTDSWYKDPSKADGGWSLEMINPQFICTGIENWSAANNLLGGTPGMINSQWKTDPDTNGPEFISLFTTAPDKIHLRFNETLDPMLVENKAAFEIIPTTEIIAAMLLEPRILELTLANNLEPEVTYHLLPFDIYDCLGNASMTSDTISFGLTSSPEVGDLLINEILFNPVSGGSRFIEVLNTSQKFIDLQTLSIGRLKGGQDDIYPTVVNEIINPGQIVVFSPDPSDILVRYQVPQPARLFQTDLPSWDEETDNVSILSAGEVIDSFTYSSAWHLPIIADQNGVSLERISKLSATAKASNWHSAASTAGYATPTGENSQKLIQTEVEMPFSVINKQFSPDDDGYKDFLALNFLLSSGDDVGSVWIYDLEGRKIKNLISNESLGTSTMVQWDGRNADEVLANMGIYIIFVELWDAYGNVKEYQETCALVLR